MESTKGKGEAEAGAPNRDNRTKTQRSFSREPEHPTKPKQIRKGRQEREKKKLRGGDTGRQRMRSYHEPSMGGT